MKKPKTPVQEVREIRHRIAKKCGNDIARIMAYAAQVVAASGIKTVATCQ